MRVAAIYDIHGNLPALDAVLGEISELGVDEVVIGGDVFPGPLPVETIERLRALEAPTRFLMGNGDREVLAGMRGEEMTTVPERFREPLRWVGQELGREYEALIASWPQTLELDVDGMGKVLFVHATPRNDIEIFTKLTQVERLEPVFAGVNADIVVCGHTHMQFDRLLELQNGALRVVNAGSVGMPFGEPGAYWLLLGPTIELRRTAYDFERAAALIRETKYPGAEEFAEKNVLQPPTEEQMLEMFGKAEMK